MASQKAYADVEIRILAKDATGYPVEITVQTGTGRQEFEGGRLNPAGGPGVAGAGYADKQYGLDLFKWLFADPKLRNYWASISSEHKQRRLRLRIAEGAPELHQYPWESLCEPDGGLPVLRLAAADATPFSRYLAGKWQPGKPIISRPIRILVAIANPNGLSTLDPPLDPIDTQQEWQALNQALQQIKGPDVELALLGEPCTLQRLAEELRKGYHILHLISHGATISGTPGAAVLFLAGDGNALLRVKDEELAEQLALQLANAEVEDEQKLRLVFLASCQTAKRSAYDAFRGVAPKLVAAGVPAVVAMQDNVGMDAAREFAKAFYLRLLEHGQVDLAANQARQWLLADAENANKLQISIPALFLRLPSGQLLGRCGAISSKSKQPTQFWPYLLRYIEMGRCTIFLGPRLNAGALSDPAEIAVHLAEFYQYPLRDKTNLARVAQFVSLKAPSLFRQDYVRHLAESLPSYLNMTLDSSVKQRLRGKRTIGEVVEEFKWVEQVRMVQENEPHLLLADLPIGLYITSNADNLMVAALDYKFAGVRAQAQAEADPEKQKALLARLPRRVQPRWEKKEAGRDQYRLDPPPDYDHRVVLHLNGFDEDPDHLVLSEDDYMHHLVRLMRDQDSMLPSDVIGKLAQDSLVFVGYELDDWEFRVILQGLLKGIAQGDQIRHVGVQLEVGQAVNEDEARKFLEDYLGSYLIDIYWGQPQQFVNELHSRWKRYMETGNATF
jgi:hypothetical protein